MLDEDFDLSYVWKALKAGLYTVGYYFFIIIMAILIAKLIGWTVTDALFRDIK